MNRLKHIIIVLALIAIVLSIYILNNFLNKDEKTHQLNLIKHEFKDREIIFSQNEFMVGENRQQLENGYWDFKFIKISESELQLCLNKLWYGIYQDIILDREYLNAIIEYINLLAQQNNLIISSTETLISDIEYDYLSLKYSKDDAEKILKYSISSDGVNLLINRRINNE